MPGVSLRHTRKAIECLRASGDGVASASLVIADDRSVLAHSGEELFDLLRGGQGVLSIVLGMERIVSEVDAAITELREARPKGHPAGVPGCQRRPATGRRLPPSSTRPRSRLLADSSATLRRSPLDRWHRDHGARLVGFGGWEMPLEFERGHAWPSTWPAGAETAIFDVSHLGTVRVVGADAEAVLQRALTNNLAKIGPWPAPVHPSAR